MTRLSLRSKKHHRLALLLAGSLVAAACSGSGGAGGESDDDADGAGGTDADAEEAGPPQPGGQVVYGLEAESVNGFCLPEAQLAISGIQVARAATDTLTVPDGEGGFQPFLAESVEPNNTFDQWTITLRDGIQFHNGEDLTAEVVKNNLDAYRNAEGQHARNSLLFSFLLQDVDTVEVTGPLQVTVTTSRPWVAFDATLYSTGRLGIVAQEQLDADGNACRSNLIGTGPFQFDGPNAWQVNDRTSLVRNENYWRTDADGNQLPYLDALEFRPIPEEQQRVNALQSGEIDAFHTSSDSSIDEMRQQADADQANIVDSDDFADVALLMPNSGRPPFDNKTARQAVTLAINNARINEVVNLGLPTIANGLFSPGSIGFLEDTGNPVQPRPGESNPDPEAARELAQRYEEETGEPLSVTLGFQATDEVRRIAELVQEDLINAGIDASTEPFDQSAIIQEAISGDFDMLTFRLVAPGGDPDQHFTFLHSGGDEPGNGDPDGDGTVANPVNFGNINDPEIDQLMVDGRTTPDPEQREQIYQDLNLELNDELSLLAGWWIIWGVPSGPDVHGIVGARPIDASGASTDGSQDYTGLSQGHDVALMWREQ